MFYGSQYPFTGTQLTHPPSKQLTTIAYPKKQTSKKPPQIPASFYYLTHKSITILPTGSSIHGTLQATEELYQSRTGSSSLQLFIMPNPTRTAVLLLLLTLSAYSQISKCPLQNALQVTQDTITVSYGGEVSLVNGKDVQCYNYTLATAFNCTPNIAISVNDLQSQYSANLFFSIKAVASDSNAVIPFVIRTQWGYTQWTKITFSFLAEVSSQIQAGYYQIDTGSLSSCCSSKAIVAFIPFISQDIPGNTAITFLNGFEVSSISVNSTYSTPFEIQVVVSKVTSQGITVLLGSTSATQVQSLFVSYIVYDPSIQNLVAGTYLYNKYVPSSYLQFAPPIGVSNSNVAFHGFSSFIVRNLQSDFQLTGQLSKGNLTFSTSSLIYYLSYSYFYLIGGPCGQCTGYSISYNGNCIATCPPNSYFNGSTCVTCQPGFIWNGNTCVSRCNSGRVWDASSSSCVCRNGGNWDGNSCVICAKGQVWNAASNKCACPSGSNWNGFVCITCTGGQTWNSQTFSCVCPGTTQWNGATCITCPPGQVWSASSSSCVCPDGSNWSGSACITCYNGLVWNSQINACGCAPGYVMFQGACALIPTCTNGQVLNSATNTCVCASNAYFNGYVCITCTNGQVWNAQSLSCACPQKYNWNGYSCILCNTGEIWNTQTNSCSCPTNQFWNGFSCITCDSGRTWSSSLNSCTCPNGLNWSGVSCVSCRAGSNWNGYSCITCAAGQIWNPAISACQCAAGQQWNGTTCITPCGAGMISVNGLCSCQAGHYQLNGACVKQPSCPSGQTWNGLQCTAIQCPPGTYWNGTVCTTSGTVTCPADTYFDGSKCITNITNCPAGTSWTGSRCEASGNCPSGTYLSGSSCIPISQLCLAGLVWQNNQCVPSGSSCPSGTYLSAGQCLPVQPCTSGRVWNSTVSQCVCSSNTFWNGNTCIQCSGGQAYQANVGCFCPTGTFYDGSKCSSVPINQCASIVSSIWNGKSCVCNTGYTVIGMQCACQGLAVNASFCDRCFKKPNSAWVNGICQCNAGLADVGGQCVVPKPQPTTPTAPSCNVATYFDSQQLRCLPCSSGCLSCSSCYSCTSCQPGFSLDFCSSLCVEVCGDGKRFTLPCDDGNNNNGDGCSSDCKVEVGFTCSGGSPSSKDSCTKTLPKALTFSSTGQSHLYGKIILNVQVNYLPLPLVQSANDCINQCGDVLSVQITSGDASQTSIIVSYIPTTSFSFSVEIDYGREPIGIFTAKIGINPKLVQKYFSGIDVSKTLSVNVNPAFLATYGEGNGSDNSDTLAP